jgi:hypothetical protein
LHEAGIRGIDVHAFKDRIGEHAVAAQTLERRAIVT